jgi:hypothetical protein
VTWAVNKCDGRRWREHGNGLIEVEGEGIPFVEPTDPRFPLMEQTWANWEPYFRAASRRHGVPLPWLLAIASVETGFVSDRPNVQASIVSPAGAQGVMQLMPGTATMYGISSAERSDPEKNIDAATAFIRALMDGYTGPELPHIGSAYNAGPGATTRGVHCSTSNEWRLRADHNYPRQVIEYNNSAREYLGIGSSTLNLGAVAGVGLAAAGVAVAYLVWTGRGPRWLGV